jgi:hypothetical protein
VDRCQLAGAEEADEFGGVAAIGLDAPARTSRGQRGRDDFAVDPERGQLPIEIVARHPGLIARADVAVALQPPEQPLNVLGTVGDLPELRLLGTGTRDARDDPLLAVVKRDVRSTLLHDRPLLSPVALFRSRNNPRLCDRGGRSFHMV